MPDAREIIRADHPEQDAVLIRTLADAFQDDPALCWILPDPALRRARLPHFFGAMIRADRNVGMVLSAPGAEVAALWRAPGHIQPSFGELIAEAFPMVRTFGLALGRAMAMNNEIAAHHPAPDDYWYLHYAAVAPDAQGKGWGGAVVRDGIARATAAGKPILLETAKEANVGIYLRFGFAVIDEWDVPKGGPHFWTMIRPLT